MVKRATRTFVVVKMITFARTNVIFKMGFITCTYVILKMRKRAPR
jgi:hypothetical protein